MKDNLKNMLGDYVTALEKENESLRKKCTDLELKIYKISEYVKKHRTPVDERNSEIFYWLTDDFDEEDILKIIGDKE